MVGVVIDGPRRRADPGEGVVLVDRAEGLDEAALAVVRIIGDEVLPAAGDGPAVEGKQEEIGEGELAEHDGDVDVLDGFDDPAGRVVMVIRGAAVGVFRPDEIALPVVEHGGLRGRVRAVLSGGDRRGSGRDQLDLGRGGRRAIDVPIVRVAGRGRRRGVGGTQRVGGHVGRVGGRFVENISQ